jgi:hypothetical protein
MKYLAFDIEIAAEIPEGTEDWKQYRPLGITCAAAIASDGQQWLWYAETVTGRFQPQMTKYQTRRLVDILGRLVKEGYTLLTWNGLSFDFNILAEESGMFNECQKLALNHIDMMFQFFCEKGYPLGLDAAAKGMGLPGKPKGMTGAKAPELWKNGEYTRVLDYVSWDVKNTLMLAQEIDKVGYLNWTARSGRANNHPIEKWVTVEKALEIPEADTSWMSDPWPREKFYGWVDKININHR